MGAVLPLTNPAVKMTIIATQWEASHSAHQQLHVLPRHARWARQRHNQRCIGGRGRRCRRSTTGISHHLRQQVEVQNNRHPICIEQPLGSMSCSCGK